MTTRKVSSVLILAGLIASALLIFTPQRVLADKDGWGIIDCYCADNNFASIGEPDQKKNKIEVGYKMHWLVVGPTDTTVEVKFAADPNYPNCSGNDPFEAHDPLKVTITNMDHKFDPFPVPKIKSDAGDKCYSYTITCTPPGGAAKSMTDPIIDVPKP